MDTPKSLKALPAHQAAYREQLLRLPYYKMVAPIVEDSSAKSSTTGLSISGYMSLRSMTSWSRSASRM